MMNNVCLIIPALNEEASLPTLLAKVLGKVDEVFVVDNGSTDNTAFIARENGASVIIEPQRGYGRACLAGIKAAKGYDIVVFMDGDMSDDPDCLPQLIRPILNNEMDFVVSTRMGPESQKAMSFLQRNGNQFACFLMKLIWNAKFTDLGPFRAISTQALSRLKMKDGNYGWTVEMQIKACKKQLRCAELSVPYQMRLAGKSKVSGTISGSIKAGVKILWVIFFEAIFP
jgi:glycosyltransferase involved in cell wall biosynthesis